MSALVALLAGVAWGGADYLGGTVARRVRSIAVTAGSQTAGLGFLLLLVGWDLRAGTNVVVYGALAGICSCIGLSALYRGLAIGSMGVVAPIAAMSAALPITWGLLTGDRVGMLGAAGIAACLLGIALVTIDARGADRQSSTAYRSIQLGIVAALGLGGALIFLARGSASSAATTTVVMRSVAALLAIGCALLVRAARPTGRDLGTVAAVGVLDATAAFAFAWAASTGSLTVAAVLSALYPVGTALLAYVFQHERLTKLQWAGFTGCLGGVLLIIA